MKKLPLLLLLLFAGFANLFSQNTTDIVFATDYTGIYNDGTSISLTDWQNFLTKTSDSSVYFPQGSYNLANETRNLELDININWFGEGDKTVILNMALRPKGNVNIYRMKWKDSPIIFRFDANTSSAPNDTVDFFASNITLQNCQMFIRNVEGTNPQKFDEVMIRNFRQDTINSADFGSSGAFIQWTNEFKSIHIEDGSIQYNSDSNYVSVIRIAGLNDKYKRSDTNITVRNVELGNLYINAANAPKPVTNKLLMTINGEGANVLTEGISVYSCNLPQFDFRGSGSAITMRNWDVEIEKVVSTAEYTDYFLINKSRGPAYEYALTIENCYVNLAFGEGQGGGGELSFMYLENDGNRQILDSELLIEGGTQVRGIRMLAGETKSFYNTLTVDGSSIRSYGATGKRAFWINDDIDRVNISNSIIEGQGSIYGFATSSGPAKEYHFHNVTFLGGFQSSAQRDVEVLKFSDCTFNGADRYNFTATKSTILTNNVFTDDTITVPNAGTVDINFEFGEAKSVKWDNTFFDLNRHKSMGTINHEFSASGLDTLIFSNNTGEINGINSIQVPIRVGNVSYLELKNNHISFGGLAESDDPQLARIETAVTDMYVADNIMQMSDGTKVDKLLGGTGTISTIRTWNNRGYLDFNNGNTITAFDTIQTTHLKDMDDVPYAKVSRLVQTGSTRSFDADDIGQIVRETTALTLTIPEDFLDMSIGDQIHIANGASTSVVLTIQGENTNVTLNGSSGGTVTLTGPYKYGILIKVGTNTYELY
jgi:hypothetical protein